MKMMMASFHSNMLSQQANLSSEMDMFLNDKSREVTSVAAVPTIKALFLKYNTGLPSSAPV